MYTFRHWYIPARMEEPLRRYIDNGIKPGDFLTAVICNDFAEICRRADDENLNNLPAYAAYFYNEAPSLAHGSKERMNEWIRAHAEKAST